MVKGPQKIAFWLHEGKHMNSSAYERALAESKAAREKYAAEMLEFRKRTAQLRATVATIKNQRKHVGETIYRAWMTLHEISLAADRDSRVAQAEITRKLQESAKGTGEGPTAGEMKELTRLRDVADGLSDDLRRTTNGVDRPTD